MSRLNKSKDGKVLAEFAMNLKTAKTTFDCEFKNVEDGNIIKEENIHSFSKAKQWIIDNVDQYNKKQT